MTGMVCTCLWRVAIGLYVGQLCQYWITFKLGMVLEAELVKCVFIGWVVLWFPLHNTWQNSNSDVVSPHVDERLLCSRSHHNLLKMSKILESPQVHSSWRSHFRIVRITWSLILLLSWVVYMKTLKSVKEGLFQGGGTNVLCNVRTCCSTRMQLLVEEQMVLGVKQRETLFGTYSWPGRGDICVC